MDQQLLDIISEFGNKKISEVGLAPLIGLLTISLFCAFFISYLYVYFYKERSTGSEIHRSFPLLSLAITAIFICIQFSLPLSLGLLGALSIVRFRTPIKEPEEIGFLMLLIASSICCATFNLAFLGALLLVATTGLLAQRYFTGILDTYLNDGMIILTLPRTIYEDAADEINRNIAKELPLSRIDSISTRGDESVLTINFHKLDNNTLATMRNTVRHYSDIAKIDVFYNNRTIS